MHGIKGILCTILSALLVPVAMSQEAAGVISIHVKIVAPSLTLTVSSSSLDFGRVTSDAGEIFIDPGSGGRDGSASGRHSTGGVLLTGAPGTPYTVSVTSPATLSNHSSLNQSLPQYSLRWANSPHCERSGFETIPHMLSMSGHLGGGGCARLQIGGVLTVNDVPPGGYSGTMTVHITNL